MFSGYSCDLHYYFHHAVGIGSTEDEDDMPYDMYSHDVEERRSPDDKQNKEEKDDRKENGVQSAKCDDPVENLVTNLVRTL